MCTACWGWMSLKHHMARCKRVLQNNWMKQHYQGCKERSVHNTTSAIPTRKHINIGTRSSESYHKWTNFQLTGLHQSTGKITQHQDQIASHPFKKELNITWVNGTILQFQCTDLILRGIHISNAKLPLQYETFCWHFGKPLWFWQRKALGVLFE